MGLYNEKKDYEELITENIKKAKLLYPLSDKDRSIVLDLLDKKEKIKIKNGILANFQLFLLDKKIQKIKNKYN